jgi:quercetin dioxygenase-like cupin family protein
VVDPLVESSFRLPQSEGSCSSSIRRCHARAGSRPHPPHRHPEEEFVILAAGTGEIEIDGVVAQVAAGDMMYAELNVLHGVVNTGQTLMTFYFTKILAKNAQEFLARL